MEVPPAEVVLGGPLNNSGNQLSLETLSAVNSLDKEKTGGGIYGCSSLIPNKINGSPTLIPKWSWTMGHCGSWRIVPIQGRIIGE